MIRTIAAVALFAPLTAFAVDTDGDTILDPADNCPTVANTNQADTSSPADGAGDACAAPNATVDLTATFGGTYMAPKSSLGANATVGAGTLVSRRTSIGAGSTVGTNVTFGRADTVGTSVTVENSTTAGYAVTIGAGGIVRAGAKLGNLSTVTGTVGAGSRVGRGATITGTLGATSTAGPDAVIELGASTGANTKLRRGVIVRAGATVGQGVTIGRGVDIGANATVGDFAVVRAGATVNANGVIDTLTTLRRGQTAPTAAPTSACGAFDTGAPKQILVSELNLCLAQLGAAFSSVQYIEVAYGHTNYLDQVCVQFGYTSYAGPVGGDACSSGANMYPSHCNQGWLGAACFNGCGNANYVGFTCN